MWSKIIFYLAWILFSAEISSAFFTKPHAVTTNQAYKPGGATTTVASRESTVQTTHPQNIQIPALTGQHLPNHLQNYQITSEQHNILPSSQVPVTAEQKLPNYFPIHQTTNEQHHALPQSAVNQHLPNHSPNHQITNEQHHALPSSQIAAVAEQHLSNHFPNHQITNDPHPTFPYSPLFHPIQPSHDVLIPSTVADHPQLFHPAALHPQHFNALPNIFNHHLHPGLAHNYHPLKFDHRPINPHDAIFHSHSGHPPIPHFIPEHAPFFHSHPLEHILANHLH